MAVRLRCINGHVWDVDSAVTTTVCPVCGTFELEMPTPPSLPSDRPAFRLDDTTVTDTAPPSLERYEILEEIGQGGMGVVYKARHRDTGQHVAVKLLRKERFHNADLVSRFRREALASQRLQHPSIVRVIEAELEGNTPYLALEYVPGITLQRLVEEGGPLPLTQACEFIRQAAVGLQHAAEQRLVHRDVKPSNLMVVAPAGLPLPPRPVVKILDMGVARLAALSEQDVSLTTLTRDGSVIGTPDYIAPEQLEDPRAVDVRADLYSLGCTFYFLLTGQVPFPGGTLIQKLDRHRWQTAPAVTQARPDVPPALATVVRRLMAKHPDDRYQTPGELVATLETLLRTGDLPGGHQAVLITPGRLLAGHPTAVAALTFMTDGTTLFSGGTDGFVRQWDVREGVELRRLGDGKHRVGALAILGGTGHVLAGQGVTVRGYDPATGRETVRMAGHNDVVRCLAVTPDGKRVLSGSDDRTVRLWDLERGREVYRFTRHRGGVTGVAVTPDGRHVLSCGHDQSVRLWELNGGREVRTFPVPRGSVLCLALSADGSELFTGHFDTSLRLWDVATGRELRRVNGHRQMVGSVAVLAGGLAVSGSHDHTLRLWDAASGAELAAVPGHPGPIACVAAALDGRQFASAGTDGSLRLWQLPG
ncbi:MAG: serine/threonine-protein kinase [Gemmataceae bacterium]